MSNKVQSEDTVSKQKLLKENSGRPNATGKYIPFQKQFSLEHRTLLSKRILDKHPDMVPVIVEKMKGSDIPDILRHKFLVSKDATLGKFIYELRQHVTLSSDKAIFLFIKGKLVPYALTMGEVYQRYMESDKFLYITYAGESTFG